jgi:hypothetical protein
MNTDHIQSHLTSSVQPTGSAPQAEAEKKRVAAAERLRLKRAAAGEKLLLDPAESALLLGWSLRYYYVMLPELPERVTLGPRCKRHRRSDLVAYVQGLPTVTAKSGEPPQLAAGKARKLARRTTAGDPAGGLAGDLQPRGPQSEQRCGLGQSVCPSNPRIRTEPEANATSHQPSGEVIR